MSVQADKLSEQTEILKDTLARASDSHSLPHVACQLQRFKAKMKA